MGSDNRGERSSGLEGVRFKWPGIGPRVLRNSIIPIFRLPLGSGNCWMGPSSDTDIKLLRILGVGPEGLGLAAHLSDTNSLTAVNVLTYFLHLWKTFVARQFIHILFKRCYRRAKTYGVSILYPPPRRAHMSGLMNTNAQASHGHTIACIPYVLSVVFLST